MRTVLRETPDFRFAAAVRRVAWREEIAIRTAMSETGNLRKLAREFRQYAGETAMPDYVEILLSAAKELESRAAERDIVGPASSETGPNAANA
jgi:hypothetical protein